MTKTSVSRAWQESSAILARDQRLLLPVGLTLFGLPTVIAQWITPRATQAMTAPSVLWLQLMLIVAALIGTVAVARLVLHHDTVGAAIATAARRAPALIAANMMVIIPAAAVAILLGAILLGVSGADLSTPDPAQIARAAGVMLIALILVMLVAVPRLMLTGAIAASEQGGPLAILRRGFQLSRGHKARLMGLFILLMLVSLALMLAVQLVVGTLIRLAGVDLAPYGLGALLLGLLLGLVQTMLGLMWATLLARLYAQIASGPLR